MKGLVKKDQKLREASVFKKTRSILGRPKITARLSPILSMDPGCKNGFRDAFFKRRASRNFWSFFPSPIKFVFLSLIFLALPGFAAEEKPAILQQVGLQDKLGTILPLELSFKNERGEEVLLGSFFNRGKPVLLTLVYYECPNLCHYLLNGLTDALKQMTWDVGKEFDPVTVSIAPQETPAIAANKKESLLQSYGRKIAPENWPFLVGREENIRKLADTLGFEYKYDAETKQYAHPPVLYFLTPEGKLARVLSGIQFAPKDLKLGLMEAARGKIGNVVDKLLLFCYRYDPKANKYTLFASRLMKGGGVLTILLFGGFYFVMLRKNSK